jgi:hypothetical protein
MLHEITKIDKECISGVCLLQIPEVVLELFLGVVSDRETAEMYLKMIEQRIDRNRKLSMSRSSSVIASPLTRSSGSSRVLINLPTRRWYQDLKAYSIAAACC